MKTQLETTAGLTATDLFLNDSARGRIDAIKKEALAEVFDVSTEAGRKLCIAHAAKVTKTKTAVDKIGKALVEPLKADAKKVDADRKIYRDALDELKAEVRRPVTEWEEAEADKALAIASAFSGLETNSNCHDSLGGLLSMPALESKLEALNRLDIDSFGDDTQKALQLIGAGKAKVKAAIKQRQDAAELEELRKMQADLKAKEEKAAEEKRIAAEAIAKHEADKENELLEKHIEKNAVFLGNREPEPKPMPCPMPWKPLDPKPKTKLMINSALIRAFCDAGGIEAGAARKILSAVADGRIDNISINY